MLRTYQKLAHISQEEFSDIVVQAQFIRSGSVGSTKLRISLKEQSYIDVWLSVSGKYSYHWERRAKAGQMFRYDNAPDFPTVPTFPKHFHDGNGNNVKESFLSDEPEEAIREILNFVRSICKKWCMVKIEQMRLQQKL